MKKKSNILNFKFKNNVNNILRDLKKIKREKKLDFDKGRLFLNKTNSFF